MSKVRLGWKGIVKVQQALNDPGGVLIYNADRSLMFEGAGDAELLRHMGNRPKVYYRAAITKDKKVSVDINAVVNQIQSW